jgi:hypothetical protein
MTPFINYFLNTPLDLSVPQPGMADVHSPTAKTRSRTDRMSKINLKPHRRMLLGELLPVIAVASSARP